MANQVHVENGYFPGEPEIAMYLEDGHETEDEKYRNHNTHSRLNLKLNCHVATGDGEFPFSSRNVRPTWMIFSKSTLHLNSWY